MRPTIALVALLSAGIGLAGGLWLSPRLAGEPDVSAPVAKPAVAAVSKPKPVKQKVKRSARKPAKVVSTQDCARLATAAERSQCFRAFFRNQKPLQGAANSLATVDGWRINTRRLQTDASSRVFIRTKNENTAKADEPAPQYLYAACRTRRHSVWLELDRPVGGKDEDIPVEISIDGGAPFRVVFAASDERTAIGVWRNGPARELLDRLKKARTVSVRPLTGSLAPNAARFDTAALERALEPVAIACA